VDMIAAKTMGWKSGLHEHEHEENVSQSVVVTVVVTGERTWVESRIG